MKINEIDYTINYHNFTQEDKNAVLDKIIDASLNIIEQSLYAFPEINRINFLINSLNETLQFQENLENYEACQLIKDLIDRINAV